MHPVIALMTAGVEMDVNGLAYRNINDDVREAVVNAHPARRISTTASFKPSMMAST